MIVIGVDAHKHSHTVVAVERATRPVAAASVTVAAGEDGHRRLLDFARGSDAERVWAIEDCRNVSGALERFLLRAGERVVRVPPKLMASERKVGAPSRQVRRDRRARGRAGSDPRARPAGGAARRPGARDRAAGRPPRADWSPSARGLQSRLRWLLHELDPDLRRPLAGWATRTRSHGSPPAGAPRADRAGPDLPRAGRAPRASSTAQIAGLERELAPLVTRATRCCSRSPAAA